MKTNFTFYTQSNGFIKSDLITLIQREGPIIKNFNLKLIFYLKPIYFVV